MATKKISALSTGTTANASDKIPIERSGANFYVTPAMISTYIGAGALDGARVFHSANQSTTSGIEKVLAFNSEVYDSNGLHDTSTNNERITIVTTGIYLVQFSGVFASNATGYRYAAIYKNVAQDLVDFQPCAAANGGATGVHISVILSLTAGDYLEVHVAQTSGGALNLVAQTANSPYFAVQQLT